jgi:hypothetical protein
MSTLDPTALRGLIATAGPAEIVISQAEASVVVDAIEIADSCARADIECNVQPVFLDGNDETWYDLDHVDPEYCDDSGPIHQAVRYLEARGLLDRHPKNPRHVKPRSPK